MEYYAVTDVGLLRKINEDSYYASDGLFIIADGMGGHVGGECASRMAVESIRAYIENNGPLNEENAGAVLRGAVESANSGIYQKSRSDKTLRGMGTTADVCLVLGDRLFVAHVGDSRVYLYSNGRLSRITSDHSYVEQLVERGAITPSEAENHPNKNIITRAVGTDEGVVTDLHSAQIKAGDILLMCSDGLTGLVGDKDIKKILAGEKTAKEMGEELVRAANEGGGTDNITVIVVKF